MSGQFSYASEQGLVREAAQQLVFGFELGKRQAVAVSVLREAEGREHVGLLGRSAFVGDPAELMWSRFTHVDIDAGDVPLVLGQSGEIFSRIFLVQLKFCS